MGNKKVLIIEDEPLIAEMLKEYFELVDQEIELIMAENLKEARKRLAETAFDACICDSRLPDGSISELFEKEIFRCPVIITTGYPDDPLLKTIRDKPETKVHIMGKPYQPADLYQRLKNLIEEN